MLERSARGVGVVVPAGVVGDPDGVGRPEDPARAARRVRAPHVQRDEPAGVARVDLAGRRAQVGDLAGVMAVAGHLVDEVVGDDRRMRLRLVHGGHRPLAREAEQVRRARRPRARRVDGAHAEPHEHAGGVEALEQSQIEWVLRACGVRAEAHQLARERGLVGGTQGVAAPARVLLQGGAAQP